MNDILKLQESMIAQEGAWHNIETAYLIESTKALLTEADEETKGGKIGEAVKTACDKIQKWFQEMVKKANELWSSASTKINAKFKKLKEKLKTVKDKPAKSETIEAPVGVDAATGEAKMGKIAVCKQSVAKLLGNIGKFFTTLKSTISAWLNAAKEGLKAAAKGTKEALTVANAKKQIAIAKQNLFIAYFSTVSKTLMAAAAILEKLGKTEGTGKALDGAIDSKNKELDARADKAELKKEEVDLLIEEIEAEIGLQESAFDFVDTLLEGKKCCKEDKDPIEEDEIDEDSEVFDEELSDLEDFLGSYED